MITLLVGDDRVSIQIHRFLLEEQAPSILDRLEDVDGQQAILLPDVTEQTIDIVAHWLYKKELCEAEPIDVFATPRRGAERQQSLGRSGKGQQPWHPTLAREEFG